MLSQTSGVLASRSHKLTLIRLAKVRIPDFKLLCECHALMHTRCHEKNDDFSLNISRYIIVAPLTSLCA